MMRTFQLIGYTRQRISKYEGSYLDLYVSSNGIEKLNEDFFDAYYIYTYIERA